MPPGPRKSIMSCSRCLVVYLPKLAAIVAMITTTTTWAFSPSSAPFLSSYSHRSTLPSSPIRPSHDVAGRYSFTPHRPNSLPPLKRKFHLSASDDGNDTDDANEEATRFQQKAQEIRAQIRQMEEKLGTERRPRYISGNNGNNDEGDGENKTGEKSLKNKRILILGANGRLGSMVTRHLLRSHPEVSEVIAAVHYVGEATTRGYGRLSYEVGAEDGIGSIGAAWSAEDERNASFEYDPQVMGGYNLNKLRVVEVELLNPTQVRTITEDVDAVIFCATDFEGNRPRAIASFNAAFLFRAVASPMKGRVEIEGVRNCLEGLAGEIKDRQWKEREEPLGGLSPSSSSGPTQFILVSTTADAFREFETPFGEFTGIKRQGERIVQDEFPSLSYSVLQMGRFDERVEEGLELVYEEVKEIDTNAADDESGASGGANWNGKQRRINRRDAARATVEALLDENLVRKQVQVYTSIR